MSYTNETTHYGIPLPLGSDKTTPMDYNNAMQAVDTALFESKTDSSSALQKANQLQQDLATTNDNVTSVTGRVTALEGTSTTQGQAIIQNAQDIADVRADALDMICAVDEGTAQVATLAHKAGTYFRYNDVLYRAISDIAIGDSIVPNTNCVATNVATELNGTTVLLSLPATTTWAVAVEAIQTAVRNSGVDISKLRLRFYSANEDNYVLFEPDQYAFTSGSSISFHGVEYVGGLIQLAMIRTHIPVRTDSDGLSQWTSDTWTVNHIATTDTILGKIELIAI